MTLASQTDDSLPAFLSAEPFPHLVLDDFFPQDRIRLVASEVAALSLPIRHTDYAHVKKRGLGDKAQMPPHTLSLIEEMNMPAFVSWIETLTGIGNLIPDHSLFGGGIHQIERGGFLKIHSDFNWHSALRLYRRVNILLYLNDEWRDEWGGHLELWNSDMNACAVRVAPVLNRMVIFSTTDESYHGHPEPLACPEGVTRNSIALYYYSAEPAPTRFGKSVLTNYRRRPGERFGNVKYRVHQLLIRWPLLRRFSPFRA